MLAVQIHAIEKDNLVNCEVILTPDRFKPPEEIMQEVMYGSGVSIICEDVGKLGCGLDSCIFLFVHKYKGSTML